ncbi:VOC family protein [uncultured Sphingomonas sp.]|uniref:VOC family protein n=1 Tax=uncultured Sphingomonas sp. TaxID=158754 RepID=UPI0035CBA245
MATLNYFAVGSNRLDEAKAFYDELLASIGWEKMFDHPSGGRLYTARGKGIFGVLAPIDGNPATVGNGFTGGFAFDTGEEVAAFHAKAIELGGTNEGDPGERAPNIHFGYFRDLDGNKLCGYKMG